MKEQIQGLHENLQKHPVTLEELKQMLNTINNIRSSSMVMELRYTDLEERFRYNLCCIILHCVTILQPANASRQPASAEQHWLWQPTELDCCAGLEFFTALKRAGSLCGRSITMPAASGLLGLILSTRQAWWTLSSLKPKLPSPPPPDSRSVCALLWFPYGVAYLAARPSTA